MLFEAAVDFVLQSSSSLCNLEPLSWKQNLGVFFCLFFFLLTCTIHGSANLGLLKDQKCEICCDVFFDASSSRNLHDKMFEVSACVIMICNPLELMRKNLLAFFFSEIKINCARRVGASFKRRSPRSSK